MSSSVQINDEMVTVVISRVIKHGKEKLYENWIKNVAKEVENFEGYQGTNIFRPKTNQRSEYVVLLHFKGHQNLNNWMESNTRKKWMIQVEPLTQGKAKIQMGTGLEYWFVLPNVPSSLSPPRHKMVFVTWLAIVPLVFLIPQILSGYLMSWPLLIQTLISAAIITLLMTYAVMPFMIRMFKFWLFPNM